MNKEEDNLMQAEIEKSIYDILADLDIEYEKIDHPAVFTVEEAEKYDSEIDAGKCKNLFLRNYKGDSHYLLIAESTKKIDLKKLSSLINEKKLSFATPERLSEHLGLTPGSVSPFGLINDISKSVRVLIDESLLKHEKLSFHPNINTSTLIIKTDDFKRFLDWTGNNISYVDLQ